MPGYIFLLIPIAKGLDYWHFTRSKNIYCASISSPALYFIFLQLCLQLQMGKNADKDLQYKGGLAFYLFPTLHNNVGVIEFTMEHKNDDTGPEWLKVVSERFIDKKSKEGYSIKSIKKF